MVKREIAAMAEKLKILEGRRQEKTDQLNKITNSLNKEVVYQENCQKARIIVQTVVEQLQKNIEFHISSLVTKALASVFPDPYTFALKFVPRRNKTEADLIFSKRGKTTDDIMNSGGGGVADIVGKIALPMACWSLKKTRPTIMLDEPTKFLHSPTYRAKAAELIKELSEKIGLQIIIIAGEGQEELIQTADKVVNVSNINGEAIIG